VAVDAQLKADLFNQYFSSMYTEEDLCNVPDLEANEGDNKSSSIDIKEEDVTALLKKVVADKSPDPDNIHPKD